MDGDVTSSPASSAEKVEQTQCVCVSEWVREAKEEPTGLVAW